MIPIIVESCRLCWLNQNKSNVQELPGTIKKCWQMKIEQHDYSEMNDSDKSQLAALWEQAFPAEPNSPASSHQFSSPEKLFLIRLDQVISSVVGVSRRTVTAGRSNVEVGAVGGVATEVAHRKSGYASALLRDAQAHMQLQSWPFGLLQCKLRNVGLYESLGWQLLSAPMHYAQPDGSRHQTDEHPMILSLGDDPWPSGEIDVNGLPF
jgi:ribosomal protein S18 acetylase RimI-like enzyme